jgi:hypothetical protein
LKLHHYRFLLCKNKGNSDNGQSLPSIAFAIAKGQWLTVAKAKIKNNKPFISAPNYVKEIIFGSLLGDAKIEMPPRGLNARFGFTQSLDKKEYFLSVLNSLGEICSGKYREMSYLDQRTGKTYTNLNF